MEGKYEKSGKGDVHFTQTLWNEVKAAGDSNTIQSRQALEILYTRYRYPLYGFLRRWGYTKENAQDGIQSFFVYMITKKLVKKASPDKGRFRSFLLASLKNHLKNQHRHDQAQKRGGQAITISLDTEQAENRYAEQQAENLNPELLFDQHWAETVLEEAMARLQQWHDRKKSRPEFSVLKPILYGNHDIRLSELAQTHDLEEGNLRTAIFRLRRRYKKFVREIVAETVSTPEQLEEELTHLKATLRELPLSQKSV